MTNELAKSRPVIEQLISQLESENELERSAARKELIEIGGVDVTRALVLELNDPRRDVRWEAAKALVSLADPIAAPALAQHLHDRDEDIRWVAAQGLGRLGLAGLLTTLTASLHHASNVEFSHAAHHAFKELRKLDIAEADLDPVIQACESPEPGVSLPVAAYRALQQLKTGKCD